MAVFNSYSGSNQRDSDITIINPSSLEDNDEHSTNTQTTTTTTEKKAQTSTHHYDGKNQDYIFVDHNPQENAKQLEQILKFYIQDLKQESNTQLVCDQQLVTRIMDLIRLAYSKNQQKMIELDGIVKEIGSLHDKRHVEQIEKMNNLRTEITHLNRMLLLTKNETCINNENNASCSMPITNQQLKSMEDYCQWTEIEDDANKLHAIVQSQQNQINEIISLMSQCGSKTTSLNQTDVPKDENSNNTSAAKPTTETSDKGVISTLVDKIKKIATQSEKSPAEGKLENLSPGTSPNQSLSTLTLRSVQPIINDQRNSTEDPQRDQPHQSFDIPITPTIPTRQKCPVCSHEFPTSSDDMVVYEHIENCLFPTGVNAQPKDYECPNCGRKYLGTEEQKYLQHLSDCYNQDV